jgi:hypothetical protein
MDMIIVLGTANFDILLSSLHLHLLGQSGRFIGIKFAHSLIKAGASVPELSTGTFYLI